MHLQDTAVDRRQQGRQLRTVEPGGQGGDAQLQGSGQGLAQTQQELAIGRQPRGPGIVIDFHTRQRQAQGLPIGDHLQDARRGIDRVQVLELAIQADHRNQRPAVALQQRPIDLRSAPAALWISLQGQDPQGGKIGT